MEATAMLLEHGELKTSFFSQFATDLPKIAITSAVSAAVAGAVVAAGIPVAIGIGIVLVVGFAASFALEYIDKKTGITEGVDKAAEKMVKDLESHMNDSFQNLQRLNDWDPQHGLIFGDSLILHRQRGWKNRNYLVCAEMI